MKKLLLIASTVLAGSFSQAASVKAQMSTQATEAQVREVAQKAEVETGAKAEVVRDAEGKLLEVIISLPEHDNAGIARATEALNESQGVSKVEVVSGAPEALINYAKQLGMVYDETSLANFNKGWEELGRRSTATRDYHTVVPLAMEKLMTENATYQARTLAQSIERLGYYTFLVEAGSTQYGYHQSVYMGRYIDPILTNAGF